MKKDNFINDILNSTNGMTDVAPNADLFSKIQLRIQEAKNVPPTTIWWIAASIAVLMAVNISALHTKKQNSEDQTTSSIAKELNQSNQLY